MNEILVEGLFGNQKVIDIIDTDFSGAKIVFNKITELKDLFEKCYKIINV